MGITHIVHTCISFKAISRLLCNNSHNTLLDTIFSTPTGHMLVQLRTVHSPNEKPSPTLLMGNQTSSDVSIQFCKEDEHILHDEVDLNDENSETDDENMYENPELFGTYEDDDNGNTRPVNDMKSFDECNNNCIGESMCDKNRPSLNGQERLIALASRDICRALVSMDLLPRLRFLMEVSIFFSKPV